jgi:hypothetical protein
MTDSPEPTPDDPLELSAALTALTSFQALTQQADTKANMLLAVQIGLGAVIATQVPELTTPGAATWTVRALHATTVGYLVAFFATGCQLIQVMRPRSADGASTGRFAFPPRAPDTGQVRASSRYSDDAWEAAREVAWIAKRKNHHIGLALGWTALMVPLAVAWMILAAVSR